MSDKKHWTDAYVDELRARAKTLRDYHDERGAEIAEMHADELLHRRIAFESEELSIPEAAEESGYHPETLRRMKREGQWSGKRGDLPRHERKGMPRTLDLSTTEPKSNSIAERINHRAMHGRTG